MYTVASFMIVKPGSNQEVLWSVNRLWNIHTLEYYSVIKTNEISNHKKTWENLKFTLLSERSQSEKATYCMILTI